MKAQTSDFNHQLADWLSTFKESWENKDIDKIMDLFVDTLSYRESPFELPKMKKEEILDLWKEVKTNQSAIQLHVQTLMIDEPKALVEWGLQFTDQQNDLQEYKGLYLLELDKRGKCVKFQQWWMKHE